MHMPLGGTIGQPAEAGQQTAGRMNQALNEALERPEEGISASSLRCALLLTFGLRCTSSSSTRLDATTHGN
jgi:hypothetical protein